MRTRVSVMLPLDVTGAQLAAVASLLSAIEQGRWEHLARSFTRMQTTGAVVAEPMAEVVGRLAQQLREAAGSGPR
jgi:hypothetical protein